MHFPDLVCRAPNEPYRLRCFYEDSSTTLSTAQSVEFTTDLAFYKRQAVATWWKLIQEGRRIEAVRAETEMGEIICVFSLYEFVQRLFKKETLPLGLMSFVKRYMLNWA
jgi:hypothetical protein